VLKNNFVKITKHGTIDFTGFRIMEKKSKLRKEKIEKRIENREKRKEKIDIGLQDLGRKTKFQS